MSSATKAAMMSVEALEAMPTAPLDTLSSGDSRGMVTLYRADMQMLIEGMQRMEAEFQEERRRREEACEALAKMDALLEARDREVQKLSGAASASSATDLRRYVRELEEMVDGLEGERAHLAGALAQRERQILEAAAENNALQASLRAAEERCVALEEGRMLLANLIDLASLPSSPPAQPDTDSYPSAEDDDGWHHHHHHGGARVEVGGRRRGRRFSFPTCDAVEPEKKMILDDDDDTLDYEVIVDELLQENKAQRQLRREDAGIKQRLREELGAAREELQCLRAEASQGRALIADLRNAMQAVGGSAAVILAQPPQRARRAGPSQVLPLDLSSVVGGRSAATAALVDDALSTGSSRRHSGLRAFSGSARGARVTPRLSSRSPDGSITCDLSSAAAAGSSGSGRRRRRSSHGAVPVAPVAVSPPSVRAAVARCDESPSPVALGRIDLVDAGRHK